MSLICFQQQGEIRDEWMDNIDWVKVKEKEKKRAADDNDDSNDEDEKPDIDKVSYYKEMVSLMQVRVRNGNILHAYALGCVFAAGMMMFME